MRLPVSLLLQQAAGMRMMSDGSSGSYDAYDGEERIFPFELELVEGALMVATGGRGDWWGSSAR